MKYLLSTSIVIIILAFLAFKIDVESKFPCNNTSCLDSLSNMNNKPYFKDSIVVIYTFLSCAPCRTLSKKINQKLNKTEYLKRIVFVNNVDFDKEKVSLYIKSNEIVFPYLMSSYPDFDGTYPIICFYGQNGKLIKKIEGYSKHSFTEIKKFIR